ncbi:zinc ribbon domain-containing protein [Methanosphaera sp. ISO3-F5]|uniref:zinc ribbon domain-containing protein n=1 Tax=Methanosphaera sp. ISO3-F5 TaxID=1452353 RepID=UPI002B25D93A|nr:zinc ribbon domain-containing protein [Methanosphaera sp. ISO3-F5]WQH63677.1 zinc ribbon domain-containing protein [Methanosphaera sp. ISO3-F5]
MTFNYFFATKYVSKKKRLLSKNKLFKNRCENMTQESNINFCINCGNKLTSNANFCIYCGAKIDDDTEDTSNISNNKIYINKANLQELLKIPYIEIIHAEKIIRMRRRGFELKTYDKMKMKLNLNNDEINEIKKYTSLE